MTGNVTVMCAWEQENDDPEDTNNWHTNCGNDFILIEDGPLDNGMKYCCYCGKEIKQFPSENIYETT